jgi:alpha-glucosidase
VKGGSIIPVGKIIQNTNEQSFDPLTLIVCLNNKGTAEGDLFMDSGDGWDFQKGNYSLLTFKAKRVGKTVKVYVSKKEGHGIFENDINKINIEVLVNGKVFKASGTLGSIPKVKIGD